MRRMNTTLQPEEKQVAFRIWNDLKRGAPDAPEQLGDAPRKIREAVLAALLLAMELRNTSANPFA
jgi:hypothetical protein